MRNRWTRDKGRQGLAMLAATLILGTTAGCVEPNPDYALEPQLAGEARVGALPRLAPGELSETPAMEAPPSAGPAQSPPADSPPVQGTTPEQPAPSAGALCDQCDPQQPACNEPGGLCLLVNGTESFCTRACDKKHHCPAGYDCLAVRVTQGSVSPYQCVPLSRSCAE